MLPLEEDGLLDRALEALPTSAEMASRIAAGEGLTRPELAVLLSYTKIVLDRWVLASDLPDDPYLADRLVQYFPEPLREQYADRMTGHRLAREIIATVAVNRFVNSQGITAYHRLSTETGAGIADIIRAQLASRAIFAVGLDEVRLRRNAGVGAADATALRVTLRRMVERSTRWLLHHQRGPLDVAATVAAYGPQIAALRPELARLLTGEQAEAAQAYQQRWEEAGLPEELAVTMSTTSQAHTLLSVVDVAGRLGLEPLRVAEVHYPLAAAPTRPGGGRSPTGWPRPSGPPSSSGGWTDCPARCGGTRWPGQHCATNCWPPMPNSPRRCSPGPIRTARPRP